MKSDVRIYERIYRILKYKIESGLLPGGSKLPARAALCRSFEVSEKSVRKALSLLANEGLIETSQGRPPLVARAFSSAAKKPLSLGKADSIAANELLRTGVIVCYPLVLNGLRQCTGDDWELPAAIAAKMDADRPTEFWRLSNRFWRFFIARGENELILRAVDGLGFSELEPLPGSRRLRKKYAADVRAFFEVVRNGGSPDAVAFDDLSSLFVFEPDDGRACRAPADSPLLTGTDGLEKGITAAEERYSGVYADILGRIAIGEYKRGDRLPSHERLREMYGVSVDSTVKAVRILREWGVVTTAPGKGIFVATDADGVRRIALSPPLTACRARRYLDSLELLSLTAEGTAAHAAACASPADARALLGEITTAWESFDPYQISPRILLEFIVDHIGFAALKSIYRVLRRNFRIGIGIPGLVTPGKTPENRSIYLLCTAAAEKLIGGDTNGFAAQTGEMFAYVRECVVDACKRLGLFAAARACYDGSTLWR